MQSEIAVVDIEPRPTGSYPEMSRTAQGSGGRARAHPLEGVGPGGKSARRLPPEKSRRQEPGYRTAREEHHPRLKTTYITSSVYIKNAGHLIPFYSKNIIGCPKNDAVL